MNLSHRNLSSSNSKREIGMASLGTKSYISDPQVSTCFCAVGDAVIVSPGFSREVSPLSELELL